MQASFVSNCSSILTLSFSRKSTGSGDNLDLELGNVDENEGLADTAEPGEYENLLTGLLE